MNLSDLEELIQELKELENYDVTLDKIKINSGDNTKCLRIEYWIKNGFKRDIGKTICIPK